MTAADALLLIRSKEASFQMKGHKNSLDFLWKRRIKKPAFNWFEMLLFNGSK